MCVPRVHQYALLRQPIHTYVHHGAPNKEQPIRGGGQLRLDLWHGGVCHDDAPGLGEACLVQQLDLVMMSEGE